MENLMDGITILSVTEKYSIGTILFILTAICIFIIIDIIIMLNIKLSRILIIYAVSITIIIIVLTILFIDGIINPNITTIYKITIDDTVSFNDFDERYEIINRDGKIYTVKERKNTKEEQKNGTD